MFLLSIKKMKFIYSKIYDSLFGETGNEADIKAKIRKFAEFFENKEDSIFSEMEQQSEMKWILKPKVCYICPNLPLRGISSPLSLKLLDDFDEMLITLIHELSHVIILQNNTGTKDALLNKLKKKYPAESNKTLIHIPVINLCNKTIKSLFPNLYKKSIAFHIKIKSTKRAQKILNEI